MNRLALGLAIVALAGAASLVLVSRTNAQGRQLGGRPGEFHFILKEQAEYNRVQFREVQTRMSRLRSDIAASATDDVTRGRMLADLDAVSLFASSMEAQLTTPAGQTAGEVEVRLNYAKGQMSCGVCHSGAASGR